MLHNIDHHSYSVWSQFPHHPLPSLYGFLWHYHISRDTCLKYSRYMILWRLFCSQKIISAYSIKIYFLFPLHGVVRGCPHSRAEAMIQGQREDGDSAWKWHIMVSFHTSPKATHMYSYKFSLEEVKTPHIEKQIFWKLHQWLSYQRIKWVNLAIKNIARKFDTNLYFY